MGDERECSCEGSVAGLLCLASLLSVIKSQTLSLLLMCVCSPTFVVLEYARNASDLNWFLCSHTHTLLYWHLAVFSHTHTLVLAPRCVLTHTHSCIGTSHTVENKSHCDFVLLRNMLIR